MKTTVIHLLFIKSLILFSLIPQLSLANTKSCKQVYSNTKAPETVKALNLLWKSETSRRLTSIINEFKARLPEGTKFTMNDLAEEIDVQPSRINLFKNGAIAPRPLEAARIAAFFEVDIDSFMVPDILFENSELIDVLSDKDRWIYSTLVESYQVYILAPSLSKIESVELDLTEPAIEKNGVFSKTWRDIKSRFKF